MTGKINLIRPYDDITRKPATFQAAARRDSMVGI